MTPSLLNRPRYGTTRRITTQAHWLLRRPSGAPAPWGPTDEVCDPIKVDRPSRIFGRRMIQVFNHRRDLLIRLGRAIQLLIQLGKARISS